eukprot:1543374-Rhodomonas_salina.2
MNVGAERGGAAAAQPPAPHAPLSSLLLHPPTHPSYPTLHAPTNQRPTYHQTARPLKTPTKNNRSQTAFRYQAPVSVEKGADLFMSTYLLHRSPMLWDNPNAFVPDRSATPYLPMPFLRGVRY